MNLHSLGLQRAVCQLRCLLDLTITSSSRRCLSSQPDPGEAVRKRNFLFSEEKRRQYEDVGRVEKIKVKVAGPPEDVSLVMNKNISTPYDCARHVSDAVAQRAALALVNSRVLWDMHCPLTADCDLSLLHFKSADPHFVNKAFWRTCSLVLGAVLCRAFKDNIPVTLHSFPSPSVRSGSFVYDVSMGLDKWEVTKDELRILSAEMVKFAAEDHKVERLAVSKELAVEMFEGNSFKQEQIPHIAAKNDGNEVILYRVDNHVDISRGPMVGTTALIGRCTLASVHKIETEVGDLYRFQGVALPKGIMLNHFAYGILEDRAKKLNSGRFPGSPRGGSDDTEVAAETATG